ncbi:polysaccharide deacetylase family protein [Clostridium sp. MB05]
MKKIMKLTTALVVILVIGFGILFIKNYKFSADNNTVSVEKNNKDSNEETKKNIEEKNTKIEEKDKINYVNLNVNDVRIPILMYHSIADTDPNNNLLVPISQFEGQVKWLKENGFTPMLLEDVVEAFNTGKVPEKPVAITFDDGYADNYTEAYRILKEHGMKATFFIITDKTDVDGWYMNSNMLKEMHKDGMGIENHTSRHIEFTKISREDKIAIIKEGINTLKEKVGVDSKFVCYPVGRYDDETIEVEKELGIKAAVTTEVGIAKASDGMYSLKRIRMSPMDIEAFKSIFSEFLK